MLSSPARFSAYAVAFALPAKRSHLFPAKLTNPTNSQDSKRGVSIRANALVKTLLASARISEPDASLIDGQTHALRIRKLRVSIAAAAHSPPCPLETPSHRQIFFTGGP
ncbi:hypothetical protein V4C53_06350 [Paraburkholderia azotifigens]|uniref:hypothetical protein n=1 Tax=Paraburkholderia azotifigens TaxID=2057004 RepID=UPI00316B273D